MEIKKAKKLARDLMDQNGLSDWSLKFDNALLRFGNCRHAFRTISLSWRLIRINEEERVRKTILHEIAHAKAGKGVGHSAVWRHECLALGIKPVRCYEITNTNVPVAPITYKCIACGHEFGRYKAINPGKLPAYKHIKCGGGLTRI
ncbi:sprT domain-containing protein [Patescibacteria group bacterium]|nr:sprT domain-containing protein [Patescibacteria group bacterium]